MSDDFRKTLVSVLICTKNEERNLEACLKSLAWADDCIVLDSYSDDATLTIARERGARVEQREFDNFSAHKNWALEHLDFKHEWILIVDADERVTPDLAREITALVNNGSPQYQGYYLARQNWFAGSRIRHGGGYPDWNLRLLRRGRGRYEGRLVHEHILLDGPPGYLKNPLIHDDYKGIERYFERHNVYSSLEAVEAYRTLTFPDQPQALRPNFWAKGPARRRFLKNLAYRYLPGRAIVKFIWMYFFKLGFLDGRMGFRYCLLHTFYDYQISLKMEELRDPQSPLSQKYLVGRPEAAWDWQGLWPAQAGSTDHPKALETENRPCGICGQPCRILLDGLFDDRFGAPGAFAIVRCDRCGLEQTWPRRAESELKDLYERFYNVGIMPDSAYRGLRERFFSSGLYRLWLRWDGDMGFHGRRGTGRLLDVGCNEGRGLRLYADNGFQVEGLEPNEAAAALARQRGFPVHTTTLKQFRPQEPFDVVVLANVLEHAWDPVAMLAEVRRLVRPEGEVWISCPNAASLWRRVFGRAWINWHVPFHLWYFSPSSLQGVLKLAGFEIATLNSYSPALWMAQSLCVGLGGQKGRSNRVMRSASVAAGLTLMARTAVLPWFRHLNGNLAGDCLLVTARPRVG